MKEKNITCRAGCGRKYTGPATDIIGWECGNCVQKKLEILGKKEK